MSQHQISDQGYLEPVTRQWTAILVSCYCLPLYVIYMCSLSRSSLRCLALNLPCWTAWTAMEVVYLDWNFVYLSSLIWLNCYVDHHSDVLLWSSLLNSNWNFVYLAWNFVYLGSLIWLFCYVEIYLDKLDFYLAMLDLWLKLDLWLNPLGSVSSFSLGNLHIAIS